MHRLVTVTKWIAVLSWMGVIWYLSDQPDLHTGLPNDWLWRKVAHVGEFAVLTVLLAVALRSGKITGRMVATAAVGALIYAIIDEWHQSRVIGRHGTPRDVVIDALGIGLALVVLNGWFLLPWQRVSGK